MSATRLSTPSVRLSRGTSRALGFLLVVGLILVAALSGPSNIDLRTSAAPRSGTTFRVATFNLLGANHTERASSGFRTYNVRMPKAIGLMNRRGFTVVGLQEFQYPQYDLWAARVDNDWDAYPGMSLGKGPVQNSIVWRTDTWTLEEKHTYQIPYFKGNLVDEPYVKLRNKNTGQSVWMVNTHNPANTHGDAERWRNQAEQIQIDLTTQLQQTGVPVLLVGDFNEKADVFCNITGHTTLLSANPGSWANGNCDPPRYIRIDWIFHSPKIDSSNYTALDTRRVQQITDHKVIYADITVP